MLEKKAEEANEKISLAQILQTKKMTKKKKNKNVCTFFRKHATGISNLS